MPVDFLQPVKKPPILRRMPIQAITVYLSSSSQVDSTYNVATAALGTAIAQHQWTLVYGGNLVGMMAVLANATRAAGGKVVGITPQVLVDKGLSDNGCDELIVAKDMRSRKALLEERGDAFITLPGGLGTFEEIFEIIVGKQLGMHNKPIVILNINNYFAPLLTMIEHGIEQRFIKTAARDYYHVSKTVEDAMKYLGSI